MEVKKNASPTNQASFKSEEGFEGSVLSFSPKKEKARSRIKASSIEKEWVCAVCTLVNSPENMMCEVCENPRLSQSQL